MSTARLLPLPSALEMDAERGRRSLRAFLLAAWPILEPQAPFVDNWHIGLAPHPDDESLGAAGLMQPVITAGGRCGSYEGYRLDVERAVLR